MKNTTPQQQKARPRFKWQTSDYAHHAIYGFILPHQCTMLCRQMDAPPRSVLPDYFIGMWIALAEDFVGE